MNDSIQSVTWWLEMVKIARKGFEVLSKGEGRATAWWPKNLARWRRKYLHLVEVPIKLYWSHWSEGSNLGWIIEVTWYIWSQLIFVEWNQVACSIWLCSRRKSKLTWLAPSLVEHWKLWHVVQRKSTQAVQTPFFIWSWVNRFVVLLRGIHHVDIWLFISAQAKPCEDWVKEWHKC